MRTIKTLENHPPLHRIFDRYAEEEMAVFLDSSLRNHLGRYSIVGLYPYLILVKGEKFTVNGRECGQSFEAYIKEYLKSHREENPTNLPIVSGAVGYFSYDYGRKKEGVESRHEKKDSIPESIFCFYDVFLVEDHGTGELHLIANGKQRDSGEMIEELLLQIGRIGEETDFGSDLAEEPGGGDTGAAGGCRVKANFEKEDYLGAVDAVVSHITEGDVYIMNLTQQLTVCSEKPPYEVFRKLRRENPSPFGGYFQYGDFQVVSASPERFLRMEQGHVVTRPIKGTRKRGETEAEDTALKEELFESEKDRSELLMIVDLERNDLNRVCVPGSVRVKELFKVETYATVFHLEAEVEGRLEQGKNVMDLMEAAFPGGSITGAPKLRAMEIIDELEHGRRGLYTGSMGYLTLDGECDFNIVIRTALHREGVYTLGVGGGITCESEREFEYEETLQKAKAVLEAIRKP
jgi:para-aminobenzoate synthetase component 1